MVRLQEFQSYHWKYKKPLLGLWGISFSGTFLKNIKWNYILYYSSNIYDYIKEQTRYVRIFLTQKSGLSDIIPNSSVITLFDDVFFGIGENQPPSKPNKPFGRILGSTNKNYMYIATGAKDNGDWFGYNWSWGDGTYTEDYPFTSKGFSIENHKWSEPGVYNIKVKSFDMSGEETEWSYPLTVYISESKSNTNKILQLSFVELFHPFPFFEKILK